MELSFMMLRGGIVVMSNKRNSSSIFIPDLWDGSD